ncbi:MAG: energy transducer TonB [Tannerellaceae bacterium]|nr:energy transducer TonB [Tannerellaceae bacterium]
MHFFEMNFYFTVDKEEVGSMAFLEIREYHEIPGGGIEFAKYIRKKMKCSVWHYLFNKKGELVVQFTLSPDGSYRQPEIINSFSPKQDKVVLKVLENMPKWKPASSRRNIWTVCQLRISFGRKRFKEYIHIHDVEQFYLSYEKVYSLHREEWFKKGSLIKFSSVPIIGEIDTVKEEAP